MRFWIKKFGSYFYDFFNYIASRLHHWSIETHRNISLHNSCAIAYSSRIEVVQGGSIFIDKNSQILDGVLILTYGGNISIGSNCSINPYTIIYGHGNTSIGNNVLIAAGCMIIPSNHNFGDIKKNIIEQGATSKGIIIEDNVWIGHACSILDNVKIGQGSIIAAGSVVTKSIPPFSVVAGVPAKVIKKRT